MSLDNHILDPASSPGVTGTTTCGRVRRGRPIGGRLCTLDGERVELLFYERGGQVLSLFVSGGDSFPETCAESKGHSVCKKDSHEFMMVAAYAVHESASLSC